LVKNPVRPTTEVTIRPVRESDRAAWEPLWFGYHEFYQRTISPKVTEFTWKRLTSREIECLLAFDARHSALGLAHFFFHPSTSTLGGNCYLQDLFVIPEARGQRVGHRLIAAVVEAARAKSVAVVYWQTEEFNGLARRLYERVAKRSPFIRYQIDL
jgi:GNAT superfamily N-acetyltransferase